MADRTLARLMFTSAARDIDTVATLLRHADSHDAIIGFHAQQAVEKLLKCALSSAGISYRRTHDIAELLDASTDSGLTTPPHSDSLDELNPFAVEARYGLESAGRLDRSSIVAKLEALSLWAEGFLKE